MVALERKASQKKNKNKKSQSSRMHSFLKQELKIHYSISRKSKMKTLSEQ